MSTEDLLRKSRHVDARRDRPKHPAGWEPGIAFKGRAGTVISEPTEQRDPEWDRILNHFSFDPEQFMVLDDTIEVRSWEGFIKTADDTIEKTTLWYHKAKIIRRGGDPAHRQDIESLIAEVKRHRPPKKAAPEGERALVANFADWQLGKEGTSTAVERILEDIDGIVTRAKELRRAGRSIGTLYLAQMGDIVESTAGHYAMQTFSVELSRVEQVRLARRLLLKAVKTCAPHFDKIVVLVTPGNHPENRNEHGKAYTNFQDNDDLEIVVQVQEVLAENPDTYGHVSFVVPDDEMSVTLDICGTIVAFAHGHQFPKKKDNFAWEWWDGQSRGMKPAGDATILVSGHRHYLSIQRKGVRTWMQAPTNDSGSTWFENVTGETTVPGTLTFVVGSDGWSDLHVL
jgi:hypothetical protein